MVRASVKIPVGRGAVSRTSLLIWPGCSQIGSAIAGDGGVDTPSRVAPGASPCYKFVPGWCADQISFPRTCPRQPAGAAGAGVASAHHLNAPRAPGLASDNTGNVFIPTPTAGPHATARGCPVGATGPAPSRDGGAPGSARTSAPPRQRTRRRTRRPVEHQKGSHPPAENRRGGAAAGWPRCAWSCHHHRTSEQAHGRARPVLAARGG